MTRRAPAPSVEFYGVAVAVSRCHVAGTCASPVRSEWEAGAVYFEQASRNLQMD